MSIANWERAAASGFEDREELARYIGSLKANETVPKWLARMTARVAVRLREMIEPGTSPAPSRAVRSHD